METKIVIIDDPLAVRRKVREAGEIIKAGGLVAFPTETVYGLGGDALNAASSVRIYAAKGRPSDNPLIIHIGRMSDLPMIARTVSAAAAILAENFWPGPLTMIFDKTERVPETTTGGLETVAVRMPDHPVALALIEASGGFVAAPSANLSGRPSPTAADHVIADMNGRIEMIVDGGDAAIGLESTIVDMTGPEPVILRPGAITGDMLSAALHRKTGIRSAADGGTGAAPRAPGMKYRHYAPRGRMLLVAGPEEQVVSDINCRILAEHQAGRKTGVIATAATAGRYSADSVKNIGRREDEAGIARGLFRILREFDDEEIEVIYSEAFAGSGMGQAIMNRLLKAAGNRVVTITANGGKFE